MYRCAVFLEHGGARGSNRWSGLGGILRPFKEGGEFLPIRTLPGGRARCFRANSYVLSSGNFILGVIFFRLENGFRCAPCMSRILKWRLSLQDLFYYCSSWNGWFIARRTVYFEVLQRRKSRQRLRKYRSILKLMVILCPNKGEEKRNKEEGGNNSHIMKEDN